MSKRSVDLIASVLVALGFAALIALAGGPLWAMVGFSYLTFLMVRE